MNDFLKKQTTVKGVTGEDICFNYLRNKGHTVYRPDDHDKAHPIDAFIVHGQKYSVCCADIKTKPKRNAYPDTGINLSHYGTYCYIKNINNIRVFIFFVDENECRIYGNWLDILEQRREVMHNGRIIVYPLWMGGQIYFPMNAMLHIANISNNDAEKLKDMRNTRYTSTLNTDQRIIDFN